MDKLVVKVLLWRAISVSLTYLVTFIVTGDIRSATSFTMLLHTVLMISNYIFERTWEKTRTVAHRESE